MLKDDSLTIGRVDRSKGPHRHYAAYPRVSLHLYSHGTGTQGRAYSVLLDPSITINRPSIEWNASGDRLESL